MQLKGLIGLVIVFLVFWKQSSYSLIVPRPMESFYEDFCLYRGLICKGVVYGFSAGDERKKEKG